MKNQTAEAAILADTAPRRGGRPPAGTDPQKRLQILDGASRVFNAVGYDAASMNDVAREADVSKATLYVYFPNKEKLFAATCGEKRDRNISEILATLDRNRPIDEMLLEFGLETVRRVSFPHVMAAHRIVIGVAERMPEIGKEFFESGPMRLANALADYLQFHAGAGRLHIDDAFLASAQFLELCFTTIFRPRLYAARLDPVTEEEVSKVVSSAVTMFLAAYATARK
jgi:TetR/AcrR family transcriptional regulator of autoinduction and epiphytic fitness